MASYNTLKEAVTSVVKTNGENAITGANLQSTLLEIINSFGGYWLFGGVARPNNNPGTPDQNVAWLAIEPGRYTKYGNVTLHNGNIGVIYWDSGHFAIFEDDITLPTSLKRGMVNIITFTNKISFTKSSNTWTVTIPSGTSIVVDGLDIAGGSMTQDWTATCTPSNDDIGVVTWDASRNPNLKFEETSNAGINDSTVVLFTFSFSAKKCSLKTDDYTAP